MRKLNSVFKTAFISEAGQELVNNDYFACVELDEYACYVMADGITDFAQSASAKLAIESIVLAFQENPSMSIKSMQSYLRQANDELLKSHRYHADRLKASVLVVVTDYEHIRYVSAGNVRLRVYRGGRVKIQSLDMSLSQKLLEDQKIEPSVLSRHEERNNLYTYLGQESNFNPYVSGKFLLEDADIVAMYTRGLWEAVDDAELEDAVADATDNPQPFVDNVEEILLAKQIADLGNYTITAIFVNKIFTDPNRQRRRRRILIVVVIILILLLVVGLIVWAFTSYRKSKVEEMNLRSGNMVACISENNYVRALEECKQALSKAESLNDKEQIDRLNKHLRLLEAIIAADNAYKDKNYIDAYEAYKNAKNASRYADLSADKYIDKRLEATEEHLSVDSMVQLANRMVEKGEFDKAEQVLLEARSRAAKLHSTEGKAQVDDALQKLYDFKKVKEEEKSKKDKKQVSDQVNDYLKMGDTLQQKGDLAGAEQKYIAAKDVAAQNDNVEGRKESLAALEKLHVAKAKKAEEVRKVAEDNANAQTTATAVEAKGDEAFNAKDFNGANVFYNTALTKYTALKDTVAVERVNKKMQAVNERLQQNNKGLEDAKNIVAEAERLHKRKDYKKAKQLYLKAQGIYASAGNTAEVDRIKIIIEQINTDLAIKGSV